MSKEERIDEIMKKARYMLEATGWYADMSNMPLGRMAEYSLRVEITSIVSENELLWAALREATSKEQP